MDIRDAAFIDLQAISASCRARWRCQTHQLSGLGPCYRELKVRVLLPVAEEQWKFGKKAIVDVPRRGDRSWIGVAIQTTLQRLGGSNKLLPCFEAVGVFILRESVSAVPHGRVSMQV